MLAPPHVDFVLDLGLAPPHDSLNRSSSLSETKFGSTQKLPSA